MKTSSQARSRRAWLALFVALLSIRLPARSQTSGGTYGYVVTPAVAAQAGPKILKVELNSDHLTSGGPFQIRVSTSSDVVAVTAGHGMRIGSLSHVAPGVFASDASLPGGVPFVTFHFNLRVTAIAGSGATTAVDIPVSYR